MYKFSYRSRKRLQGVHPDLVAVVENALKITQQDFSILEGVRTKQRQYNLYRSGKSQTLNSRHLTGHAVDVIPYPVSWEFEYFYPIADAIIQSAKELDVKIRWGGNWKVRDLRLWEGSSKELVSQYQGKFFDLPHFEIPRE